MRWNSLNDSIQVIVGVLRKINGLMLALKLPSFKDTELDFLQE